MTIQQQYAQKRKTLADAQELIHSGDVIAVSGAITEPVVFLGDLQRIIPRLENVTLIKSKDNDYEYLRDPATAVCIRHLVLQVRLLLQRAWSRQSGCTTI